MAPPPTILNPTSANVALKEIHRTPTASEFSSTNSEVGSEPTIEVLPKEASSPPTKSWRDTLEPRLWSLLTVTLLYASAPLVISATVVLVALYRLFYSTPQVAFNGKVAIISGGKMTKSFVIMKHLKAQGCRIVLVETHKYWMVASRFSKCVDRFVTVPVPEADPEAYLAAMKKLADEEQPDIFVPVTSPVASQYEARVTAVLPPTCHSWSLCPEDVEWLDDKVLYCEAAEQMGLSVPVSHRVCSHEDVHAMNAKFAAEEAAGGKPTRHILKNLQYDSMHRLDLFTLPCSRAKLDAYLADIVIDEKNPWTVQTFIVGQEYSSCAFAVDGRLLAFTDNAASISCFNYAPARNPQIREWVETFCANKRLSGIACFDFIVDETTGIPYSIECNPRASSNLANFYNHAGFGAVLAHPHEISTTVEPLADVVETYWLFAEVWAAVAKPGLTFSTAMSRLAGLAHTVVYKKDAYFDFTDPLPFLASLYVHLPALLVRNMIKGNKWAKIDPCIGKLTEENGD